jgi:hypothetical protein
MGSEGTAGWVSENRPIRSRFHNTSLARPVLLPVSTFGPEPPFYTAGEGGAYVRPRDAFYRVMFHRVAPMTESAASFLLE